MSTEDKVLSSILGLLILATIGAIVYVSHSMPGERFTEFYILGLEGKAEGYPRELVAGEEGRVLLRIVNREHQEMNYRLVVRIDGMEYDEIGPIVLAYEEQWKQEVSFIPEKAGENQKVEFLLFKEGEEKPYSSLYLWLEVKEQG